MFAIRKALPKGIIAQWYGSIASIPSGWALCNGANGTPDLRDRFIVAAKEDEGGVAKTNVTGALTQTGGSKNHNHTFTGDGHSHPVGGMPVWTTGSGDGVGNASANGTTDTDSNLSPYYALTYIMKL